MKKNKIAYFSPEFAIENELPIYAGGLGVLAGDHLRASAELKIDIIGIGLFYRNGYFVQKISKNGTQKDCYHCHNPIECGLEPVLNESSQTLIISMALGNEVLFFQAFKKKIHDVELFLLDTDLEINNPCFRNITDKLYGGDREHRLQQEILLGIGGIKLLKELKIEPDFIHINEGHAAFALLEWHKNYAINNVKSFKHSIEINKDKALFTTHTPVKHGNEVFEKKLINLYFVNYVKDLNISIEEFLEFGSDSNIIDTELSHSLIAKSNLENDDFSMTLLAFNLCSNYNGVSKLHGEVSRELWKGAFKKENSNEVPIKSITNGVDINFWTAKPIIDLLIKQNIINYSYMIDNKDNYDSFSNIADSELLFVRQELKNKLIDFIRKSYRLNKPEFIKRDKFKSFDEILDNNALTIGFSRRFAQYKRADLLFNDIARLKSIIHNSKYPVQFVFSGKAHPMDIEGKEMLKKVIRFITENHLEKRIVFLENYDLNIAKYIVHGCDVWLNNPIKPLEASGTSGMKSALNGGVNFSIADGWWAEAFNEKNGYLIDDSGNDETTAENIYRIIENRLIFDFYSDKDNWIKMMKESMFTAFSKFGSCRMVYDYNEMFYQQTKKSN